MGSNVCRETLSDDPLKADRKSAFCIIESAGLPDRTGWSIDGAEATDGAGDCIPDADNSLVAMTTTDGHELRRPHRRNTISLGHNELLIEAEIHPNNSDDVYTTDGNNSGDQQGDESIDTGNNSSSSNRSVATSPPEPALPPVEQQIQSSASTSDGGQRPAAVAIAAETAAAATAHEPANQPEINAANGVQNPPVDEDQRLDDVIKHYEFKLKRMKAIRDRRLASKRNRDIATASLEPAAGPSHAQASVSQIQRSASKNADGKRRAAKKINSASLAAAAAAPAKHQSDKSPVVIATDRFRKRIPSANEDQLDDDFIRQCKLKFMLMRAMRARPLRSVRTQLPIPVSATFSVVGSNANVVVRAVEESDFAAALRKVVGPVITGKQVRFLDENNNSNNKSVVTAAAAAVVDDGSTDTDDGSSKSKSRRKRMSVPGRSLTDGARISQLKQSARRRCRFEQLFSAPTSVSCCAKQLASDQFRMVVFERGDACLGCQPAPTGATSSATEHEPIHLNVDFRVVNIERIKSNTS